MPRTTVASMSTAAARPIPIILSWTSDSVARIEKTATMILTSSAVEELTSASALSRMLTEAAMSNWVRAAALDDISEGGARSFAYLDKRIALFRTPGGVFACDNRCPHQGYALVRGDVTDGVLTCAWHNWKFEVGTGTCRHGGGDIRTYPAHIPARQVFIDLAHPPAPILPPELFL